MKESYVDSIAERDWIDTVFLVRDKITATAKNGKPYFNLKATNGQVIGASQMYAGAASMENGIKSVAKNAPGASVVELP